VAEAIRFHLDEHMDPAIADALRGYGIDVTTTLEEGLRTRADDEQWQFVLARRRVIVTDDTDFLRLAASTPNHPGVVFCRRKDHPLGDILRFLQLVHGVLEADEIRGRVEYL
jgi:predicted nuclease of predicted toxin-antitoxin system